MESEMLGFGFRVPLFCKRSQSQVGRCTHGFAFNSIYIHHVAVPLGTSNAIARGVWNPNLQNKGPLPIREYSRVQIIGVAVSRNLLATVRDVLSISFSVIAAI